MALSVDGVSDAGNMVDLVGAEYPVLADAEAVVSREYGVYDLLGDGVAAPAVFILEPSGQVVSWHIGRDIADRPSADDIIAQLAQIVS